MSELDDAIEKKINYIIYTEHRPFSYRDFLSFEIDGKHYTMEHGTFRNNVSRLMKEGRVKREYISGLAFYSIKGVSFGKRNHKPARRMMTQPMTPYHMGDMRVPSDCHCHQQQQQHRQQTSDSGSTGHGRHATIATTTAADAAAIDSRTASIHTLCSLIQEIPLDKNSLHDIRLRFEVPDIWTILSLWLERANSHQPQLQQQQQLQAQQRQQVLRFNPISKDISLPPWQIKELNIKVTVHRTDTVSVVVGCSHATVAADINGVIRLSNALTRVEERLSHLVDDCGKVLPGGYESLPIPEHHIWNVTMWHFGADASIEYTGEKFSATWEVGQNVLVRIYSKHMEDGNTRIRLERQEYPKKTLAAAIEEKLYYNNNVSRGGIS